VAFDEPTQVAKFTQDASLTQQQRSRMRAAIDDATSQLATGAGYSNELLVAAVNEICGLELTPVTMVE
jgi:phage-related tail protein